MTRAVWIFVLFCTASSMLMGGLDKWKTYTIKSQVQDIAIDMYNPALIWVATSGGMFSYDKGKNVFQEFTTSEGLRTIDLTAIATDKQGAVWIGAADGFLHRYLPTKKDWRYILNIYNDKDHGSYKRINSLKILGDTLYILSDLGVSVFSRSKMMFTDNYLHARATKAKALEIFDNRIWVATDHGIASTLLTNPNPSAPDLWETYLFSDTVTQGLPSNFITSLSVFNNHLIAGTDKGLAQFVNSRWTIIPETKGLNIIDLRVTNPSTDTDTIYFITSNNQLGHFSSLSPIQIDTQFSYPLSKILNQHIVGTKSDGLLIKTDLSWNIVTPPGPISNKFVSIVVDKKGVLWAATGADIFGRGFMSFDGQSWKSYTREQYPVLGLNGYYKVSLGRDNTKWVSSWGTNGGVAIVDDDGIIQKVLNTSNGLPLFDANSPNYTVVGGVATDPEGRTWITSRSPLRDTILAIFHHSDSSISYLLQDSTRCFTPNCRMKNPDIVFTDVVIDQYGTKWFANFNRFEPISPLGLYYFNNNKNFILPGTINNWGKLTTDDGLTSNKVWCIKVDNEGGLWIGSDQGITIIFNPGNPKRSMALYHPLQDQVIQDIAVDVLDNKWVATKQQGVFVLSPDGTSILNQYTVENTNGKLLDNDINSIAIDNNTGLIYFGSEKGLSTLTTSAITPKASFEKLLFSPNPFYLPSSIQLTVKGLVRSSSIKILSIDGSLIKEIQSPGGLVGFWDGTDSRGNLVSTGIYLVVAYAEDGNEVTTGKLAVIRK
ncbi:MAG: two-component regulator propeller domain-containing protein [Bacteroidota bacterium]|nr:two-component regulator propeller domain-containing protein [Bacteroidota bacterium]